MLAIGRVDDNLAIVIGAIANTLAGPADLPPTGSAVVAAENLVADGRFLDHEAAHQLLPTIGFALPNDICVIYCCVDDVRIAGKKVDSDFAEIAAGQTIIEFLPRFTLVRRPVDSAARPGSSKSPRHPLSVISNGHELVRIIGAESHFGCADVAAVDVDAERFPPGVAAVGCLEYAAFRVLRIQVSLCGHEHRVGVVWMNDYPANVMGFGEPHVGPRFATVGRPVHTVAVVSAVSEVGFAGPDPDDVVV